MIDASERVPNRPLLRDDLVWLDPPNATLQELDVWDNMDTDLAAKLHQDTAPTLPKSPLLVDDNDDDSTSMFTTIRALEPLKTLLRHFNLLK